MRHLPNSLISVLVVDNDRWVTRALAAAIKSTEDLEVVAAVHSGEEAIEAYERQRPDVVLMDVNMAPGMNGIDATTSILEHDPSANIVVLTTLAPGPGLAHALAAGAIAVVDKNASDATLFKTVRLAARGENPALLRGLIEGVLISGDKLGDAPTVVPNLTRSERQVLKLICTGLTYGEIAQQLHVAESTVLFHTKSLRMKVGAKNLAQLVIRAIEYRYVDLI
ncbi:response regulator transcription factor [Microbacterium protaetiae]|uniref:Response regulator transcription factor n=1 Tax=Microbacterium protaetiae TaxID=2509458 RepID=A0A4P6EG65_9MICO|nr:response regulator transcription factor [Microbacterium protaetiae]QAY60413.1 response regulator transcription factor [Microbacterium protaetiae]